MKLLDLIFAKIVLFVLPLSCYFTSNLIDLVATYETKCTFEFDSIAGRDILIEADSMAYFDYKDYTPQYYILEKSKEDSLYYSSWRVLPGRRLEMTLIFIVSKDGEPVFFRVARHTELNFWEKRTVEILKNGPKWRPGVCMGLPQNTRVILKIQLFWN